MSRSCLFAARHRRQTDHAVHAAFGALRGDPAAQDCFARLLQAVRERAPRLLSAPWRMSGRGEPGSSIANPGVAVLLNLARFHALHLRPLDDWPGDGGSWYAAAASLAQHLLARYAMPRFLASAWHAADDAPGDEPRRWYVAHGAGASFRSLDLPLAMTRAMEHRFLASADHLAIRPAMQRAELLALGADDGQVAAVLASGCAPRRHDRDFWRSVWAFLVAHANEIRCDEIGPLLDWLQALRDDAARRFSMKGRTPQSLRRLMHGWHLGLGAGGDGGLHWTPSTTLRPMVLPLPPTEPLQEPVVWTLRELTTAAQLRAEGRALQHCVLRYAPRCRIGHASIWSLGRQRGGAFRRVLTVEVDPSRRRIVQARGFRNAGPSSRAMQVLRTWAAREQLTVALSA